MRKRAQLRSKPVIEEPRHVAMKVKPVKEEKSSRFNFRKNWWIAVSLVGIFLLILFIDYKLLIKNNKILLNRFQV